MLFLLTGFLAYFVFIAVFWVLTNFGLYRMAKHAGLPHAGLAFVPVGNAWVLGMLAERSIYTYTRQSRRLAVWAAVLQAVPLAGLVMMVALIIADSDFNALVAVSLLLVAVGGIVGTVLYFYALYYVFKDYSPDNALLFLLLGIFFGIYWIFLLVEMNSVPVSVTGFGAFPYGRPKYDRYHQWDQSAAGQGYPPPGYGGQAPYYGQQTYTGNPNPGGPYTTNPGQPPQPGPSQPYQGQGQQFYQGQGYYQPQQPQTPPERPRDDGENYNGPEL